MNAWARSEPHNSLCMLPSKYKNTAFNRYITAAKRYKIAWSYLLSRICCEWKCWTSSRSSHATNSMFLTSWRSFLSRIAFRNSLKVIFVKNGCFTSSKIISLKCFRRSTDWKLLSRWITSRKIESQMNLAYSLEPWSITNKRNMSDIITESGGMLLSKLAFAFAWCHTCSHSSFDKYLHRCCCFSLAAFGSKKWMTATEIVFCEVGLFTFGSYFSDSLSFCAVSCPWVLERMSSSEYLSSGITSRQVIDGLGTMNLCVGSTFGLSGGGYESNKWIKRWNIQQGLQAYLSSDIW